MRFDRRLITHFEWLLPLLALAVAGLGTLTVLSATQSPGAPRLTTFTARQLTWIAAGCVGMLVVQRAQQLGVVVTDGGTSLPAAGRPAMRPPLDTCRDADRFSRRSHGRCSRPVHVPAGARSPGPGSVRPVRATG